jgi:hypothetical protein
MRCFFPVRALDAIRIISVCAATVPDVAAAAFSDTIRFNSALSLDVIPAAIKIGHRHHSVMLVSRTAALRSAANCNGVCLCAMWVKLSSGMFVPHGGEAGAFSFEQDKISVPGQSLPGPIGNKSSHVRCAAESGSKFTALAAAQPADAA